MCKYKPEGIRLGGTVKEVLGMEKFWVLGVGFWAK